MKMVILWEPNEKEYGDSSIFKTLLYIYNYFKIKKMPKQKFLIFVYGAKCGPPPTSVTLLFLPQPQSLVLPPRQVFAQGLESSPLAFIKGLTSPLNVVISPHHSDLRSNIFAYFGTPHMNTSFYRLSYIMCHFYTALSTAVTVCSSVQYLLIHIYAFPHTVS